MGGGGGGGGGGEGEGGGLGRYCSCMRKISSHARWLVNGMQVRELS